ncbi:MAG: DinB family protein, partial [Bacteroidota bacterium]|nr:DinB family protein [Bacteroidota bacterium]
MKNMLALALLLMSFPLFAQNKTTHSLRSALLEQLRSTHNKKEWFVPLNIAVEGLSAEKAMWKDSSGNHSVAQLVGHLVFWNAQTLAKMKKQKPESFSGNNEETFEKVDAAQWAKAVKS